MGKGTTETEEQILKEAEMDADRTWTLKYEKADEKNDVST